VGVLTPSAGASSRSREERRGRRLEVFTLAWNLAEAGVGVGAAVAAGSIALFGFGIDSVIESVSGGVLLWRLQASFGPGREERALKLVGWSFLLLAAYVAFESVKALLTHEEPEPSVVGIALACASLVVMPLLARAKRHVASRITSRALHADSRQTDLCAYLSATLLAGLALNAVLGWWWADPAAALVMVPIIVHEGVEGLRGETCDECRPVT
jgi:divalent metal cation (Fe/Co/Zn/Cd) transporter